MLTQECRYRSASASTSNTLILYFYGTCIYLFLFFLLTPHRPFNVITNPIANLYPIVLPDTKKAHFKINK